MAQQYKIGKVATAIRRSDDGSFECVYHSTAVVSVAPNGDVTLDSGGWRTHTTKTRMNQAANEWELGFGVYQKNFEWFVWFPNSDRSEIPFTDGMVIS